MKQFKIQNEKCKIKYVKSLYERKKIFAFLILHFALSLHRPAEDFLERVHDEFEKRYHLGTRIDGV